METPFEVTIYDKAFQRKGWVGDYEQLTVTPRHNAIGTGSLTVRANHGRLGDLLAPGARVTVNYDGAQIMSGPCWAAEGTIPTSQSTVTFAIEDDLRVLGQALGWPVPGASISAQSAATHDVRTGPAETVIKAYAQADLVTRLGLPVTVAASLGRGATVSVKARMDNLRDLLLPYADIGGIGVSVRQGISGLDFDCYVPTVRTQLLNEASGILAGGSWSRTGPSATDVIVGGQGEGVARTFRRVTNEGRVTEWGTRVEAFRDATDVSTAAELDARGALTLAEGAPGAGISLELAETATFRYGRTVRVGDVVTVEIAPGFTLTDVVRSVVLAHGRDSGLTVTPRAGAETSTADPNATLAKAISRLAAAVRRITTKG